MADYRLADIAKNGRERLRIDVAEYRGAVSVDVRIYANNADGALVPTKAGVAVRPHMLRETIAALLEAERVLVADGLLKPEAGR